MQADLRLQPRHGGELRQGWGAAVEPGGHTAVGQLGVVQHYGAVHVGCSHGAVGVHLHVHHHGQSFLPLVQRCGVGGQHLGQHGEHARRRVDGCGVGGGMCVHRAAHGHQHIHVGHRHHQPRAAAGQSLRHAQLVQVQRVVVVDGKPGECAQVVDAGLCECTGHMLRPGCAGGFGFLQRLGCEGRQQATCVHGLLGELFQVDGHGCLLRGFCASDPVLL